MGFEGRTPSSLERLLQLLGGPPSLRRGGPAILPSWLPPLVATSRFSRLPPCQGLVGWRGIGPPLDVRWAYMCDLTVVASRGTKAAQETRTLTPLTSWL